MEEWHSPDEGQGGDEEAMYQWDHREIVMKAQ